MLSFKAWPKRLERYLLGALLVLIFTGHSIHAWRIPLLEVLDAYFYDVRVRLSAPGGVDDRIVVVDLDERSLAAEGRWPWGRNKVAELVRRLVDDYQVAVVGFDVVFAEPDESSGIRVLESLVKGRLKDDERFHENLLRLKPELDYDQRLADTLRGRPVVLGYYFNSGTGASAGALPPPAFPVGSFSEIQKSLVRRDSYGANLPELQAAAAGAGHFNPLVDFDGVTRRVPLLIEFQGAYYEALSLAVLRSYLGGVTGLQAGIPDPATGMEWLDLQAGQQTFRIPVDAQAAALVPYRGPERSFPYISATDILHGQVDKSRLQGRIVLVGTSAPGLLDLRSTPVGGAYPGVEVHANLIAGVMDQTVLDKLTYYTVFTDTLLLLLVGGVLAWLLPHLSPIRTTWITWGALLVILGINFLSWAWGGIVLPLASGISMVLMLFVFNVAWGFFVEARSKRQFTELFGQYVPPELVDEMAKNPEEYSMEGRTAELTVLFSDVRNFTTLSEGMSPRDLTALMNEYLGTMTQVIRRHRGTLDKYIGDAIMAFWGAPVADEEHAQRAVQAALEMQDALEQLNQRFEAKGWPRLAIGIGINSGPMTVGDMGSPVRKAYTVMGDAVNLGSRLEGLTKAYGVGIIVGDGTRKLLAHTPFRELDRVRVKGKDVSVAIHEPLSTLEPGGEKHLALWQQALRYYREQAWDQAELQWINLEREAPEYQHLCALYRERVAYFRQHPPGDEWDGAFTFQSK